jgi:3-hydroxyisobutyrate dehydrogenase-like beta-hydroxyacid dehydrogenase
MTDTVGIVGVGNMGAALLHRLKQAGAEVLVYDVDSRAVERAREAGGRPMASVAELAREASIVDVVVRVDEDVLACTVGPDGALAGARSDSLLLIHSTVLPETTQRVAEAATARGVHVLDACMHGRPAAVRRGDVLFIVGGPVDLVERARPHLLRMGSEVRHVGPLGAGNLCKLLGNIVNGVQGQLLQEVIRLAEAGGMTAADALDVLQEGYGATYHELYHRPPDPTDGVRVRGMSPNLTEQVLPRVLAMIDRYEVDAPLLEKLSGLGTPAQSQS